MKKRGQMQISFGILFSIILIIMFLAFSVYGIMKLLDFQKSVIFGQFTNNLQDDINKMWGGTQGSKPREYNVPKQAEEVCFHDSNSPNRGPKVSYMDDLGLVSTGTSNLYFYPVGSSMGQNTKTIKNIDIAKITINENPYCIPNSEGKIKMTIKMDFGDSLVSII